MNGGAGDDGTGWREAGTAPGTGFPVATTVRDALYDRIPLAAPELALIDLPVFQRLDRIQQLGFVSRVWPGARHARYEHSLGVLHLARLAIAHLARVAPNRFTRDDARVAVAAALLHDIGHYPFSHAIEELGGPVAPHEEVGAGIVLGTEVAAVLRDAWGVDPARVAALISPRGRVLPPADRLLRGVLSGPLDVDKLDYLPRDARACNVPYGGVDTARLIDALAVAEVDADGGAVAEPRVVVGDKGISPLHSLINARQEMFDNVYWHHTNRACMAMLQRAVQDALAAGAIAAGELTGHDDATLLAALAHPAMPETTRRLTLALRDRRVHKRAVEIGARARELYGRLGNLWFDPQARRRVERGMAVALQAVVGRPVPDDAVLIDIPKPERWRTDVWVRFQRPPVGFRPLMPWREVVGLGDDDFKRYEEHRRLIRIVAAAPYREAVAAHWERLLLPQLGGVL
jgi:uncharacterized protein